MQLDVWIEFALKNGLEIFLAVLIMLGARWARPFISESEWSDQIKMFIDFVILCQAWLTCPIIFVSNCVVEGWFDTKVREAVIMATIGVTILALLALLNWKRAEFFSKKLWIRVCFKATPIALLLSKMFLEKRYAHLN